MKSVSVTWKGVWPLLLLKVILWIVNSCKSKWFARAISEEKEASQYDSTRRRESTDICSTKFWLPRVPVRLAKLEIILPQKFSVCSQHVHRNLQAVAWLIRKTSREFSSKQSQLSKTYLSYHQNVSDRFSSQPKWGSFVGQVCICKC